MRNHFFICLGRVVCTALALWLPVASAWAEDLGVIGPLYEIREQHAIEYIKAKLLEKQKNGELAKWEADSKARVVDAIRKPVPIPGLGKTDTARTFYYDPTMTVVQNIVDHQGNVLYPAGYRKNPLEVFTMTKYLLFFDATDPKQVVFARELIKHYDGRVKPILVGGSYLDLMRNWKLQVYYDQRGLLTTRFGIKNVPALVSQEGMLLRIDELKVQG
ncbi:MAG: type-F conjugative transfer system protein TraW [Rhizobacter sp.]